MARYRIDELSADEVRLLQHPSKPVEKWTPAHKSLFDRELATFNFDGFWTTLPTERGLRALAAHLGRQR